MTGGMVVVMIKKAIRCLSAWAAVATIAASSVHADPIVIGSASDSVFGLGAANIDINGDGIKETEYSRIFQQFARTSIAGTSMTISFNYMFLTSQASAGGGDTFRIGVRTLDGTFLGTSASNNPLLGTVVNPGDPFTGIGDQYDFVNHTVNGAAAPNINVPLVAGAGGKGFADQAGLLDGAIGWQTGSFTFGSGNAGDQVIFEALVADGGDGLIESVLLLDNVVLTKSAAVPGRRPAANGGTINNSGFEDFLAAGDQQGGLKDWTTAGEAGVYYGGAPHIDNPGGMVTGAQAITDTAGNDAVPAAGGKFFAAIGTQNSSSQPLVLIPEPSSMAGFGLGLALLAGARRRKA